MFDPFPFSFILDIYTARKYLVHLFRSNRNFVDQHGSHSNYENYHRTHAKISIVCLVNNFRAFRELATRQQIFNLLPSVSAIDRE